MTAVLIVLAVLFVVVCLLFLVACVKIERLQDQMRGCEDIQHSECMERVMWHVRGEFAALVLRTAASRWDSVENQPTLDRLRTSWRPGHPGVAAQWMREQANQWAEQERYLDV